MKSIIATLLVVACGCGTQRLRTASDFAAATTVTRDDYRRSVEIAGPVVRTFPTSLSLRAFATNGKVEIYQVYFAGSRSSQDGWAFYHSAYDANGAKLPVHVIAQDVDRGIGVWVNEHVAIDLSRDYLERAATTGLKLRIYGKNANMDVKIGDDYISLSCQDH